jgi:hypothetical protein
VSSASYIRGVIKKVIYFKNASSGGSIEALVDSVGHLVHGGF